MPNRLYRRNFFLLVLCLLGVMVGCVPVRKQTYLQERTNELKDYPKDSVVKDFSIAPYEYYLQPGDVVMLQVKSLTSQEFDFLSATAPTSSSVNQDPLLSGYEISAEGTISLPYIGKVEIAGLSIKQAKEILEVKIGEYLKSPVVHLKLLNFKITVMGEVGTQASFYSYDPKITVLEAIARAGGVTEFADRANVKIVRTEGEKVSIVFVDLLDDNLIESPYYYLQPNDQIIVRPLKAKTFNNFAARNISLGISILTAITLLTLRLGGN